jgi:hypothetical protein
MTIDKEKIREYQKKYYEKNKDKINARIKERYDSDEEYREYRKKLALDDYHKDIDKKRIERREYYQENKDKINAERKERYHTDPEYRQKVLNIRKAYYYKNKDKDQ